jgi:tetraacyldisaccharide 4'-kinase
VSVSFVTRYRDVISGQRRGLGGAALRGVLGCAAKLYGAGVYCRNLRYDRAGSAVHSVGVPVISVGNVTTGGTGKTPMVAWLASWFRERGTRVAVISRGYRAEPGLPNDEAMELQMQFPDLPHVQNPDRVAGARQAIQEFAAQLILLDDAFQHRRIHRDLDLVLIDALEPFGYGHLLPRGLLREPLSALSRARVIALSRADLVTSERRAVLRAEVLRRAPQAAWVEVAHRPRSLVGVNSETTELAPLRGKRVAAFCGIGNPAGFCRTLANEGAEVVAFREFPDHYAYHDEDLAALAEWSDGADVAAVVCTMKDFVKLRVERLGRQPLCALAIGVELLAGRGEFEAILSTFVARGAT